MEDAVAISSTGGTTGEPKGAIHTNRSFEAVVASVYALFQFDEPPVHLIVAPLTHAAAIFHYALLPRSDEHTSELQSLMRISYAVFCLKKKLIKILVLLKASATVIIPNHMNVLVILMHFH